MLKIYGDIISGNCLKVKWTADFLGLAYEWAPTDILAGDTRTDTFLAMNPVGQVPTIQFDDGGALAQSNAIIIYLAESADSDLIPADLRARAKMMEWLFWEQYNHETAIAVRRFHKHYLKKSDDDIDPALLTKGYQALQIMDDALGKSAPSDGWIAGEAFTLADIALVAYTRLAPEGGFDLSPYPHVTAWISRVERKLDLTPVH